MRAAPTRLIAALSSAVLLPPALAALALAALRPEAASPLLGAGIAITWLASLVALRGVGARAAGPVLGLACLGLLAWPEVGLRVAGYRHESAGGVQFGFPQPEDMIQFEPDPELWWRLTRRRVGANAYGFMSPEFVIPKPEGMRRIVFLGDSCTQQGFPQRVETQLNVARAPGTPISEAVNLGVSGYTTYQGRIVARRWLARLEGDVAVILYGWNDHWQAFGRTDAERGAAAAERWTIRLTSASRLAQWLGSLNAPDAAAPLGRPRVSVEAYRANLAAIAETALAAGAQPVLATAPSSHRRLGVPDYLLDRGFADSAEQVIEVHGVYNDAVRALARERGWPLVDLEREAQQLPDMAAVFTLDGIHFTKPGMDWTAARFAGALD